MANTHLVANNEMRRPAIDYLLALLVCTPLQTDTMPGETSSEAVEIITAAIDKFLATENYEVSS